MPGTISFMKQSFPGAPTFIEKDVPDLNGKVYTALCCNEYFARNYH